MSHMISGCPRGAFAVLEHARDRVEATIQRAIRRRAVAAAARPAGLPGEYADTLLAAA